MSDDESATSSGQDQLVSKQTNPTTQGFNAPRSSLTQSQIQQQCLNDGRNGYGVLKTYSLAYESLTRPFGEVLS
jgi:uncharacterized protein YijF (DUF1287 family)